MTTLDDVAAVRAVHASPDLPTVDVYVEGIFIPLGTDLEYGDATDFGLLPAIKGAVVEIRPAGADPKSEPILKTDAVTFVLAPSELSTAAIGGLAGSDGESDSLRVVLDPEDFDIVTGGTWRARFSNMVSDVAEIEIDIGSDGTVDETVERFRPTDPEGIPLSSDSTTYITIRIPGAGQYSGGMPPFEEGWEMFVYVTGVTTAPPGDPMQLQLLFMNQDSETVLAPLDPFLD